MWLNMTTDYAIRLILCLAEKKEVTAGSAIAREMEIPPKYINKISSRLRAANLIASTPGSRGGYHLTKPLEEITLLEVLDAMDPSLKFLRHLELERFGKYREAENSLVHLYFQEIWEELEKKWLSRNLLEIQQRSVRPEKAGADAEISPPYGRTSTKGGKSSVEKEKSSHTDRSCGGRGTDRGDCHIPTDGEWQFE
nr:Rrf2 family transcriptional regulator [uncultured Mediterraneibacter sp.]